MYKIFDAHVHTYPEKISDKATVALGNFYQFNVKCKGTLKDFTERGKDTGLGGFLLFSVATNAQQVTNVNNGIAESVRIACDNGYKAVGYMGMHQDFENFDDEVDRCIGMGLKGVKIHPDIQGVNIDDKKLYPLYESIEGRVPVYFHMGDNREEYRYSDAPRLLKVLEDFPRLTAVAAHLSGYRAQDRHVPALAGHERIWYDTSSAIWTMTPEMATDIIKKLGTERVFFGSDYPVKDTAGEVEAFLKLSLSEKEKEDILWNNAAEFFSLD